jgi:ribosomal protein S18 acetylase RimI-like enzyme
MSPITFRPFTPADAPRLVELQGRSLRLCADIRPIEAGFYLSPAFEQGQNISCAVDPQDRLLGYAAIYPNYVSRRLGARLLWTDLRVEPELPEAGELRDALLERTIVRAGEIRDELRQPVALSATYFAEGRASIDYLLSRGFAHYESVFLMRRDLAQPIPDLPTPEGVQVRRWRLETEAEQRAYVEACNQAFQDDGRSLGELQHFMRSPMWGVGTTIAAFAGDQVAGNVMVFYDPAQPPGAERFGATEWVFVLPQWRRRGVARYLLREALVYLRERGLAYAELQVVADNRQGLGLYEAVGYWLYREEISVGLVLP